MTQATQIERHKTAIRRPDLSLPVKCALRDGLLSAEKTLFDYGCGQGRDLELLARQGFDCSGWDPAHRPEVARSSADVVNLGYVINVIESPDERDETLSLAWGFASQLLVVSAQIAVRGRGTTQLEFGDGVLTRLGTFQKYFSQAELREYLESRLETQAIPAAPGVFYVFKDQGLREQFIASRYRRRPGQPRKRISERKFEEHRDILDLLIECMTRLGRLPEPDEFPDASAIIEQFGSIKRAFALIRRVTSAEAWEGIRQQRVNDLSVYLALGRFRKRPQLSKLPIALQRDIRAFFGTYKRACETADELLFQSGETDAVDETCRTSPLGKQLPTALYLHKSFVEALPPILRVYEGCARTYLGEIEDANIVKLHRDSATVSYLSYPEFDSDPHPALVRSVRLALGTCELSVIDYGTSDNPPVLHRKETFVAPEYPQFEKFARLTRQEERHGLFEGTSTIGTRDGWEDRLSEVGFQLRGHRLVRRKQN